MRPWAIESKIASPVARSPHATPRDQQPALCVRMKVTRLVQQLASGHPREPLSRKDQGDLLTGSRKVLETGERLVQTIGRQMTR